MKKFSWLSAGLLCFVLLFPSCGRIPENSGTQSLTEQDTAHTASADSVSSNSAASAASSDLSGQSAVIDRAVASSHVSEVSEPEQAGQSSSPASKESTAQPSASAAETTKGTSSSPGSASSAAPVPAANPAPTSSAHEHHYSASTVAATCTEGGYTLHTCSCGAIYKDNLTAAAGHLWGEWVTTTEATFEREGVQTRTCRACGATETRSISKLEVKCATPSDAKAITERILYYINQYRTEEGKSPAVMLPNATAYAEARARQLTTNFAHDTVDERSAATVLKYGKYRSSEDLASFGFTDTTPFYESCCGEAIVGGPTNGYSPTIEEIAQNYSVSIHNSSGHWAYVGNANNTYISVGVCYGNGGWYCAIECSDPQYG